MDIDNRDFLKMDLYAEEAPAQNANNDLGFEVTADMMIRDLIQVHPFAQDILMTYGMPCVGCPVSLMETVGEAAMVHGIDLDCLLEDLNSDFSMFEYDEMDEYSGYIENSERS